MRVPATIEHRPAKFIDEDGRNPGGVATKATTKKGLTGRNIPSAVNYKTNPILIGQISPGRASDFRRQILGRNIWIADQQPWHGPKGCHTATSVANVQAGITAGICGRRHGYRSN